MDSKTRNIKLTIEYDGSRFYGFQKQPRVRSIQSELEKAFKRLFGRKIKISSASGRTDSGVHALGQVVNFKVNHAMPVRSMQKALNALLPEDAAVRKAEEVPADFHARFSAKSKCYEYRIWNEFSRSPLLRNQSWHVREPLDIEEMKKAARHLTGKHDFKSVCTHNGLNLDSGKSTVRTIRDIKIFRKGSLISIRVTADGFLYRMVRNIVGLLAETGRKKLTPDAVKKILAARDRRHSVMGAPPQGLFLKSVTY